MLEIRNLNIYYGAVHANKNLNLSVKEGEIVCLLGANGAGKSTLLRGISGLIKPKDGDIDFLGKRLNDIPPFKRVSEGIALVPEGRGIIPGLSVRENLRIGAYIHLKDKRGVMDTMNVQLERFPRLRERLDQKAGTLSGGEQQMLAISRGLMSNPRLILLDEPSMGLSPILVTEVFKLIQLIRDEGTTVLLVEQNAKAALKISDRGYILTMGEINLSGSAIDLSENDAVRVAYLT